VSLSWLFVSYRVSGEAAPVLIARPDVEGWTVALDKDDKRSIAFTAFDGSDGTPTFAAALWRYTPAVPDNAGLHLRPWIALVVLEESEFSEGKNIADRPLPYITVSDASVFPPADQLWAWAHVHFNSSLSGGPGEVVSPDMGAVLPRRTGN